MTAPSLAVERQPEGSHPQHQSAVSVRYLRQRSPTRRVLTELELGGNLSARSPATTLGGSKAPGKGTHFNKLQLWKYLLSGKHVKFCGRCEYSNRLEISLDHLRVYRLTEDIRGKKNLVNFLKGGQVGVLGYGRDRDAEVVFQQIGEGRQKQATQVKSASSNRWVLKTVMRERGRSLVENKSPVVNEPRKDGGGGSHITTTPA